jgi:TPR repeat protein
MRKWILIIGTILLLYSSVARADALGDGVEAYKKNNFAQALELLLPLATQGNAVAQYALGLMYNNGEGVTKDYQEAAKWFRLAAEQGSVNAQYNLGSMYNNGEGVTKDYQEAAKWYRLAAEQGSVNAQYNLGLMYSNGEGATQNYVRAHMWFSLAASKGNKDAKENLVHVVRKMTASQIADAQRIARDCEKKKYKNCE